jgi:hypothetical protein
MVIVYWKIRRVSRFVTSRVQEESVLLRILANVTTVTAEKRVQPDVRLDSMAKHALTRVIVMVNRATRKMENAVVLLEKLEILVNHVKRENLD